MINLMKDSRPWFRLALIGPLLLIAASPHHPEKTVRRNQQPAAIQNRQPESSVPLASFNALQATLTQAMTALHAAQDAARQQHPQKDWWDRAGVIANYLLVIVGGVYTYFAWGQWTAINESTNIAHKTLLLQFRPHLIVRHVGLLTEPDQMLVTNEAGRTETVPIETVLILNNRGGTQGEIIDANVTVRVLKRPPGLQASMQRKPLLPQYERHSGLPVYGDQPIALQERVIMPGAALTIKRVMPVADHIADAVEGYLATHHERNLENLALLVFGYFRYRDQTGNSYITAFCRQYDRTEQRFVIVDNPDYEFTD
jgi:hypothetical protein